MTIGPHAVEPRRAVRILLLGLALAVLLAVKLTALPGTGPFGADGAFYVNAARNVQEGVGLKTNVSMYHYGQTELPTRSRLIYPLWPLLLGTVARVIGLFPAVNYLPLLFYLTDLLLLYLLGTRLMERMDPGTAPGWLTPALLLVLLLGFNFQFFGPTTYPYTEGLGFFQAFGALLLIDRAPARRPALWGALSGVFSGLALLTRSQLVIAGLAILIAACWAALSDRRFLPAAVAFAAAFGAVMAYWYFFVFHVQESPRTELPFFRMWLEPATPAAWWRERVEGIAVSVSPFHPNSFFHAFHAAFLIPLAGAAFALVRWLRGPARSVRLRAEAVLPAACALYGLGTYISLNLFHQDPSFFVPWLFGYRHGLPMVAGIAVAAAYLWTLRPAGRGIVIASALVAILSGVNSVLAYVTTPIRRSPTPAEARLASWLDAQPSRPLVITAKPQHLSVYTHANVHWTECRTPAATTRVMLEKLPIDYVIVYATERRCAFVRGLGDVLVERTAFGEGRDRIHVLVPRPRGR